jgi:NAD(P) transhydrogenase subunit alpha
MTSTTSGRPHQPDGLTIAVVAEREPGERRVALVPEVAARLIGAGHQVLVEAGAGEAAWFPDDSYRAAGAEVVSADHIRDADIVFAVHSLSPSRLRPGQCLIGLLQPLLQPKVMQEFAESQVTAISLDGLPRTLSQAQTMDALTSQASVAGYKAALVAADTFGGYFPMLMTAAGTVRPAQVLVLGGGVAGLQAIGTASRLGAVVSGYDVRPEARGDIESLGARFVELGTVSAAGTGGYARALTDDETRAQQSALGDVIARQDVVIATAAVPGRRPPMLVTAETLNRMRPGSVVLDLAAGPLGGNVEGSQPDQTIVTIGGVSVIGAGNLPARMPVAASTAYARNLQAVLAHLAPGGTLSINTDDPIQAGVVITHAGAVVHPATLALLDGASDTPQEDPHELHPVR